VLQANTSFSPTCSQASGCLHPSYTYTMPSRLSAITAFCYCSSLPSRLCALVTFCPQRSLPLWEQHENVEECLPSAHPSPVHSQGCTFNPQSRYPPSTLLPNPGFSSFIPYILQEIAQLSVCARQLQSSILRNFGCLVACLSHVVSECDHAKAGNTPRELV